MTITRTMLALCLGVMPMLTASQLSAQTSPTALEFVTSQPANQSLARVFLGANVTNTDGEVVGDVNDLMFDSTGMIRTVVIGVGGFLGMGEKSVAVPYSALTIGTGTNGVRTIVIKASTETLKLAPIFKATEKTTMDVVRDKASDIGAKTVDKAKELTDQAAKKIDEMSKDAPVKK